MRGNPTVRIWGEIYAALNRVAERHRLAISDLVSVALLAGLRSYKLEIYLRRVYGLKPRYARKVAIELREELSKELKGAKELKEAVEVVENA